MAVNVIIGAGVSVGGYVARGVAGGSGAVALGATVSGSPPQADSASTMQIIAASAKPILRATPLPTCAVLPATDTPSP